MMTCQAVLDHVIAEPFRPFRLLLSDGQAFDIRYPEMIAVGRSSVSVYTVNGDDPDEKWLSASLTSISTIESLGAPSIR